MAWLDDIAVLNNAATTDDWSITSYYDSPTLNDSSATTPIFLEGSACMWWPLKKSGNNGYVGTATITGTPSMTGRVLVGFINYPFADIDAIPITLIQMRMSSSTGFTTNYAQWNALTQLASPYNTPISGHTPVMGYPDAATETGTPNYGAIESVGWVASTGGTNDGKQGGFDWFFVIGYLGAHSASLNGTYFSGMYDEYYDNAGQGLPGETSRPVGVLSQAGNFFQTNVKFQLGDGTSDTNNIVVDETGKTIFFNNLHVNHELGYVFVNPSSTHECRFTITDCVHFWNDQSATAEIFKDATNADDFKVTGCSFSDGGKITLPSDNTDRWVRGSKFSNCKSGTASDGEFTNNILNACLAMTISGDADFSGTQVLEAAVGADASGLVWNGNFDPDGNLDGMVFSKGTNSHHAVEFGPASPLEMTLRNCDFQNFGGTNGQTNSTFHVKRTTGTVTINLFGCTGNTTYKSDGATVSIVVSPVTTTVKILDGRDNSNLQNARVILRASDGTGDLPYQDSVTITQTGGTATVSHTGHGLVTGNKVEIRGATNHADYNGAKTITVTGANAYTYSVESGAPSPATGTITSTGLVLEGLSDVNGEISDTRTWSLAQNVSGRASKATTSPIFKDGNLTGIVSTTLGLSITQALVIDE